MFDKTKMYIQAPKEIRINGLIRILTDINGNEFNADNYDKNFEITIDYPQEKGDGVKVVDYRICVDGSERTFWSLARRRQWINDPKLSFCGSWVDGGVKNKT
ncbi:hypothetical protein J4429_04895 [Candidatus Pacearchaeota archaeon]|nr:hypothetical protein [Candidatus Pacearchaeota archaeon]